MNVLLRSLARRLAYRLRNEPADIVPAIARFSRFLVRRAKAEINNRRVEKTTGYVEHFGVHMPRNNAGDTVLFDMVERLFDNQITPFQWHLTNLRKRVDDTDVDRINQTARAVLVGGGGLFMKNENPQSPSGWQWNITVDQVRRIRPPLILFAVGYNQFRGAEPLGRKFEEHLEATIDQAMFVGLRNSGSIAGLKAHLPEALHSKLRLQPCMTTTLKHYVPVANIAPAEGSRDIAINLAFDQRHLRFGGNEDRILADIAKILKHAISLGYRLHAAVHSWDDDPMVDFLRKERIDARVTRLNLDGPQKIVGFYARMPLTIGMRGHAQMIPFGCGNAIYSVISHNKMKYFLDDIGHPEWGADVQSGAFVEHAIDFLDRFESRRPSIRRSIDAAVGRNWEITKANFVDIKRLLEQYR